MSQNQSSIEIELQKESELLKRAAIEAHLKMTYEQRIEAHENARELCLLLNEAGERLRTRHQKTGE